MRFSIYELHLDNVSLTALTSFSILSKCNCPKCYIASMKWLWRKKLAASRFRGGCLHLYGHLFTTGQEMLATFPPMFRLLKHFLLKAYLSNYTNLSFIVATLGQTNMPACIGLDTTLHLWWPCKTRPLSDSRTLITLQAALTVHEHSTWPKQTVNCSTTKNASSFSAAIRWGYPIAAAVTRTC